MKKLFLISILFSAILFACKTSKEATSGGSGTDIISITHGTSFGMCRGYCIKEETYTSTGLTTSQKSWDSTRLKPMVQNQVFSAEEYNALAALVNKKDWYKLDETIGCPDCADRGSEYVIITDSKGTKKVTFDAHSQVPEIAALLAKLRENRIKIETSPFEEDY